MANRLAAETSPYLLQHAANPVDWQPWDEAALARARAEDRPILLSVGYSACHWCHVMAHESFEDPAVAAVMNELFVNVKVDREERPDLDQIYQTAHQMLTGRAGGWPLTLFLTPDGTPFFGGTYFPKTSRHGLPAFPDLCRQVARAYREKRSAIDAQNLSLRDALADLERRPATADFHGSAADLVAAVRNGLLRAFDPRHGGFGGAPKFPHPTDLALLLRRPGDDGARSAALATLARMAEGGLFDQLAGGFCRYSVDERWEIPHFEKMLYDNGQLLGLYAEAWRQSGEPLFAAVVERTADWLMAEMQAPEGGYRAALDADSEGEEGKFYVWDRDEVRAALSPDEWRVAAPVWGLDGPPNFENRHWHLRVAATVAAGDEALLASARATLLARRGRRVRPGCDDKVLTAWNALAIAGMAAAARVFGRPDWLASARRALEFIRAALWRDGRLLAAWRAGKAHLPAYLDDHAFLLAALLELLRADFRPADLAFATAIADTLLARFEDAADGGFFFTAHDHETLIHRPKPAFDNATPAGNGVAATALQRLGHLTGEPRYLAAARRTLDRFLPQLAARPVGASALLEALEESERPPTRVILRGPAAEVADWQRRLADRADWVLGIANGAAGLPPALAKPESATVNAWVCSGVACLAPVADFDQLKEVLQAPRFPLDCRFAFSPHPTIVR